MKITETQLRKIIRNTLLELTGQGSIGRGYKLGKGKTSAATKSASAAEKTADIAYKSAQDTTKKATIAYEKAKVHAAIAYRITKVFVVTYKHEIAFALGGAFAGIALFLTAKRAWEVITNKENA